MKKHIVFLTPGFAYSEKDSTTIPALQVFLKALKKAKPDIVMTIITFQFPFFKETYNWNGIKVIPLNGNNNKFKKIVTWRRAFLLLKELHKKSPLTAIHSFWIGECSYIGEKFSLKYGIKHVITAMGQDANSNNRYASRLKKTKCYLVTLSNNHNKLLSHNYDLKSTVIPWGLDCLSFPVLKKNEIDILGVGSLNVIKNYPDFVTVISTLKKTYPNIKVEILGSGREEKKIKALILKLELEKNILIRGELPRKQVIEKMAQSNILLHTSTYESFGYVFLEALYSGMHIASYKVGIAEQMYKWHICSTKEEMTQACTSLLKTVVKEKERKLLTTEEKTITSYLNLYNA